jgi:hypothetical protein
MITHTEAPDTSTPVTESTCCCHQQIMSVPLRLGEPERGSQIIKHKKKREGARISGSDIVDMVIM